MNLLTFDLNLLKVFNALLTEGSTVKAAERVGLSQPAVSAALRRLRDVFADPLFVRAGQRLEPTALAVDLKPDVEQAILLITGMLERGSHFNPSAASGVIRLSGSDFFSELMLPPLLETLRLSAPNLKVVLIDQVFETSLAALENGHVDIAFWPDLSAPKWVNRAFILETRFEFVARAGHPRLVSAGVRDGQPLPLDLACDLAHVHFSPDAITEDDFDAVLARHGRARRIIATVPTFSGVVSIVRNSDVIGTLPVHFTDHLRANEDLTRHPLPLSRPDIPLYMLWHRRADNAPVQAWIREQIKQIFAALPPL
jgi:DNA-binding transcriptional LysR family regulator